MYVVARSVLPIIDKNGILVNEIVKNKEYGYSY